MKLLFIILFSLNALAHDEGGGGASIGKGKGVESYDEHDGFSLAEAAIKRIGIKVEAIEVSTKCNLKSAQIVSSLSEKKIYIKRGINFKGVRIKCESLKQGDLVVVKGAEFLRVIEMDLTGGEGEHEEEGNSEETHAPNQKEKHSDKHSEEEHHD